KGRGRRRRGLRKNRAADVGDTVEYGAFAGDEAFETAATVESTGHDDGTHGGTFAATADEVAPSDDVATSVLPAQDASAGSGLVAPKTSTVPRGEQPMLGGDVVYTLPPEESLAKGLPHKVRSA